MRYLVVVLLVGGCAGQKLWEDPKYVADYDACAEKVSGVATLSTFASPVMNLYRREVNKCMVEKGWKRVSHSKPLPSPQ